MALDPAKLLAYEIPKGKQTLTPRDAALYALSVGMGQDPLDARQLVFVDPTPKMRVMPSMALVLAHPGFWLGDPATSVDATGVLHAEQALELLSELPAEGVVTSETVVTRLTDKGPGKAALLVTETMLHNEEGKALARLERTTFLRGGGGFGGDNPASDPPRPARPRPADHIVDLATRPEQALLYRLNGDLNPLHADPALASQAGFRRPILHGLCTAGLVCHALLSALADYDQRRLTGFRLRFTGPVYPGETLRTEIWDDGVFRVNVLERNAAVVEGGTAAVVPAAATSRRRELAL